MTPVRPLRAYLGRFVLPAVLLAAAIGAWIVATELEQVERASASSSSTATPQSLSAPLASIRRIGDFATSTAHQERLAGALASLPPDPGGLSCVSVFVDGQAVLEQRSDRPLVPSYAQLLITGHAAIDLLGADYRYTTQVLATELPDLNGRIFDSVYLDGGGDPVLMSYKYSLGFRPVHTTRTAIEELAANVASAGVLQIDGGVIGIERRFDDERSLPGRPPEFAESGIVGPLSALLLDGGFIQRAVPDVSVAIPSEQPATMAAERFADELLDNEVQVLGAYRTLSADEELPTLVVITQISSPPLGDIVRQTLADNDATAAEMIVKELGVASGVGSTQSGGRAIQQLLQDQGVDVPVPFRDGSGIDPFGGTSCNQLATTADTIPDGHPTLDVLPAYDLPGVFDGRFRDVDIAADLRLVGGIENDASGFVARTVDDGSGDEGSGDEGSGDEWTRVTIASIINRPGGPTDKDLAYQQALVELVDTLRLSTNVEALGIGD